MSQKTKDYSKLKSLLEEQEKFPLHFIFKFIGRNTPVFLEGVKSLEATFPTLKHEMTRKSAKDQHIAMTYAISAPNAHLIIEVFRAIEKIEDLLIIL
jgi:putative lipoic acid-binding regulatory protein